MIQQLQSILGSFEYLPWLPELVAALILFALVIILVNFFFSFVSSLFKFR